MRGALIAAAAIFIAVSTPVLAEDLPPGMTMHRLQAGELDANGWAVAASSTGNFSVKVPCLFNDFTIQDQDASAAVTKAHAVGCLRPDKRKFSASRMIYRQGAAAAEKYFAKVSKGEGLEGTFDFAPLTFKGFDAVAVVERRSSRCGFFRFVRVNADIILLGVEAPQAACDGLKEQSETFFNSLQVDTKGTR